MGFYYSPKIVTDGLVFYVDAANRKSYPGSGVDWNDLSGNEYNGTLINGTSFDPLNNGSFIFNGVNNYIDFPELLPANTVNNFSFGLWFSPSVTITPGSLANFSMLAEAQDQRFTSSRPDNYIYFLTNGQLLFATFTPTNNVASIQTIWNSDEWYHVFCTYESSTGTKKLFINGEVENSITGIAGNYFNTFTHFGLGAYNSTTSFSPSNAFNGKMANYMMYTKTLSEEEVLQNYNALKSRYGL
jgi:hypothetical protein